MRCRDFWILCLVLISLVFSTLLLLPGTTHRGLLPSVAIATFIYPLNTTAVYPEPPKNCLYWCPSDFYREWPAIHEFFFTVHYLSLCGGYMGGEATPLYKHLECQSKRLGWTFRTDDPFIVNFGAQNGTRPLASDDIELVKVETVTPVATLLVGLICSVLAFLILVADMCDAGNRWDFDIPTGSAALLGVASTFLMLSAALVTNAWHSSDWFPRGRTHYKNFTVHFIALGWCAMGFMYLAFVGKVVDNVWRKESQRRMMRGGRI